MNPQYPPQQYPPQGPPQQFQQQGPPPPQQFQSGPLPPQAAQQFQQGPPQPFQQQAPQQHAPPLQQAPPQHQQGPPLVQQAPQQFQQGPPPVQQVQDQFQQLPPVSQYQQAPPPAVPQQPYPTQGQQYQQQGPPQGPPQFTQSQQSPLASSGQQQQQFQQQPPLQQYPQQYPPQGPPQQQYQQGAQQFQQPQHQQYPQQQPYPIQSQQQQYPQQQQQYPMQPQQQYPQQQVGQQPPQLLSLPAEDANVHTVTISKAASTGKVVNNGTIPRFTVEQRENERVQIPLAGVNPNYIKPAKLTSARATLRSIPSTPQIADQVQLPLGITVRPLGEVGLPLVDFAAMGDVPVVRCKRCRGYINPYVTFQEGGRRWQCVMCRGINDVPPRYFSPLNHQTGLREDLLQRPELCNASVELVAPAEYMVRPPQRPIFLVLLDVSYNAVQSGMLRAQCEGVLSALDQLKDDDSMYMSVIAYDSTIYLFNLRSTLQAPKMIVAPDLVNDVVAVNENSLLDSVELPALAEDLVVSVRDSMHLLTQLFEKLPGMFTGTKNVDCAFGPALTTSMSLLTPSGGKIIASVSAAPSLGEGRVQARTDKKLINQPKEYTMSLPANDWYKQRSLACSQAQISVDLLINGASDVDLATLAPISRYTGGHIHRFAPHLMGGLRQQMERILVRDTAFEAVLRVRAASGLTVPNFFGHCYVRGPDLLALPMTDSDSAYALQLQLTGPLTSAFTYVQIALLYTSRSRERRIRVHTVQLGVSNSIPRIFNSGDVVAMSSFLSKMCVDNSVSCAFGIAQQKINDKVVAALKFFKKQVTNPAKYSSSLALPESMKALPFLLCGYYRCAATRNISTVETLPDDRVASMSLVMTAPVDAFLSYVTASTFCVFNPREPLENLPIQQLPTQDTLKSDGIYLIDTGACRIVWIGNHVDPRVLCEFGLDQLGSSLASDGALTNGDDVAELSHRFSDLSAKLEGMSGGAAVAPLVTCRQGEGAIERIVGVSFVDDDVKEAMSLGNFLAFLQRKVATD